MSQVVSVGRTLSILDSLTTRWTALVDRINDHRYDIDMNISNDRMQLHGVAKGFLVLLSSHCNQCLDATDYKWTLGDGYVVKVCLKSGTVLLDFGRCIVIAWIAVSMVDKVRCPKCLVSRLSNISRWPVWVRAGPASQRRVPETDQLAASSVVAWHI